MTHPEPPLPMREDAQYHATYCKSFDAWVDDDSTHWIGDRDAAWQAWMHLHDTTIRALLEANARITAENAALKAERDRLREALQLLLDAQARDTDRPDWMYACDKARAALEPKRG